MAELGLQIDKHRFEVILDRIRKVKEKLGKKNKEKEYLRGQYHPANQKGTDSVPPYSTLSSWLEDLDRIQNPLAEDILHLSPVGRRRFPSYASHTTSTPVSLTIQPLNSIGSTSRN
jgi:hypothetical protein